MEIRRHFKEDPLTSETDGGTVTSFELHCDSEELAEILYWIGAAAANGDKDCQRLLKNTSCTNYHNGELKSTAVIKTDVI